MYTERRLGPSRSLLVQDGSGRFLDLVWGFLLSFCFMGRTAMVCTIAWFIPGGGHLFLSRWKRGVTYSLVVLVLFFIGLSMNGKLFGLEEGFFGFLRFFADLAIGLPYLMGLFLGWGEGDIRSLGYEYGNTYLYTAGLINMLLVLDAFDIALGRKQ